MSSLRSSKDSALFVKNIVQQLYGTDDPEEIKRIEEHSLDDNLQPVVKELKDKINTDQKFNMLFNQMFRNVPDHLKNDMIITDPTTALCVINKILTMPPPFTAEHPYCPINAILVHPLQTTEGFTVVMDPEINKYIKNILTAWRAFLQSEESCQFLTTESPNGWFCDVALKKSQIVYYNELGQLQSQDFIDAFKVDLDVKYAGFKSWDGYFTRELKEGARPVAGKDNPKVIVNPCESSPYRLDFDVKAIDEFYLKSQKYSITFMLNNDPLAPEFIGGTVYQAYLDYMNYHRYHSPVDGEVIKVQYVEGGYYTECREVFQEGQGVDYIPSMAYLCEIQTRVLIFIKSNTPSIGVMCFVAIGMGDVCSCEVFVNVGQKVLKGQQMGMFHYGASCYCLCFRKGVQLEFNLRGQEPGHANAKIIPINSLIATVVN